MDLDKKTFEEIINRRVIYDRLSYMESIIAEADARGVEPQDFSKLISKSLKDKIEYEAMNLNMLPKKNELPFN